MAKQSWEQLLMAKWQWEWLFDGKTDSCQFFLDHFGLPSFLFLFRSFWTALNFFKFRSFPFDGPELLMGHHFVWWWEQLFGGIIRQWCG